MKQYWIRKGTNNFSYEYYDFDANISTVDLSRGDQFYDAILEKPALGATHVIDYQSYQALLVEAKKLRALLEKRKFHDEPGNIFEEVEKAIESFNSFLQEIEK